MNFVTWILIGESFLILVSLVIAIAVYTWRKKRRLLTALDVLLTNLSNAEPERKATLTERLKIASQIDEAKANLLSDEIFCAERQFIQELIQLLLSPGTDKIAGFNEDIYALVTPYWELLSLDRVAAEDLEAESTSNLTELTPDIEIDEDDVVVSSEVADQPLSTQDLNESDQSQDADQSMPVPPAEGLSTDKGVDDTPVVTTQDEPKRIKSADPEGYEPFVADIVEDEDLAEETTDSVEAEEDEPSWDDAFDEAAQEQEVRVVNLDKNDDAESKSKKVPEL